MILKSRESIVAYRCPQCGSSILSMVGVFALSGDLIKLKCDCGESELVIMRQPGDKIKLVIPCIICPNPHVFTLSTNSFFTRDLITLACPMSGINVGFIGKEQYVRDALDETERELDRLLEAAELDNFDKLRDTNDGITATDETELAHLAQFVIAELREDGLISCECADPEDADYDYAIDGDNITVFCHTCDAEYTVNVSTQAQLDDFIMCDEMRLTKPEN